MFYLDYIVYITFIILTWILIYKIINMKETENTKKKLTRAMVMKEGFAHRGNAIVVKREGTNQLGLKDLNPNSKNVDIISTTQSFYSFLGIFADAFVKYPNKYIRKLGSMAQGPLESLFNTFKEFLKNTKDRGKDIIKKVKPYFNKTTPWSPADITKNITKLIDKIFGSIGQLLNPNNPK